MELKRDINGSDVKSDVKGFIRLLKKADGFENHIAG